VKNLITPCNKNFYLPIVENTIGRYQHQPIPIISKTAGNRTKPIIGASLFLRTDSNQDEWMGQWESPKT